MLSRQNLLLGGLAAVAVQPATEALAHHSARYKNFKVDPRYKPQTVRYTGYASGTIIVDPANHFLYLVISVTWARRRPRRAALQGQGNDCP